MDTHRLFDTSPEGPCEYMVNTWGAKRFPCAGTLPKNNHMVFSQDRGALIYTPKYRHPYSWDHPKDTHTFRKP